ncbi:Aquaporin-1 [Elasticomyces elasticus]|uniref:Aquaporin-1 n=1 Tax=Exophiala sideris TaxID=1016849 RepID=A0ABR0JKY8_9EURO|nr:Aquaporin-1 [Elasticomyces elasticus]KAK5035195.1 Aquaporin-1 [Exophiala sideris]KAK5039453.1 Aquaporin-1 [Exophiala sideris]KAK5066119.1 Aquaporin-1 [Exophiala sideris]KAK5186796.1 Aquaporin-1 [Eurotiomycetes sp. CCFEE 6388]
MDNINAKSGFLPGLFGKGRIRNHFNSTGATPHGEDEKMQGPKPISFFMRIPNGPRNHFIAMAGEFVGTFLFLFFAFAGTQVANTPQTTTGSTSTNLPQGPVPAQLLYISLCFGFSLAVNAWIFFRISGGLFNPAVTLGLCLIGAVPFLRGGLVFIAQMLGAMAAAGVVSCLFPGPLAVTTSLSGGTSKVQGLFIEMFLTTQLVFTIFMLAAEKHKGTFLAPVGIGLSLFIAELAGVYYTGGSLNPARSFGPCVASRSFPSEHWIYWVGPLLGSLVASGFFWFIKSCEYQTANPGQDFDDLEATAYNPEHDLTRPVVSPTAVIEPMSSRDSAPKTSRDEDRAASLLPQHRVTSSQGSNSQYQGANPAYQGTNPTFQSTNPTYQGTNAPGVNGTAAVHHRATVDSYAS